MNPALATIPTPNRRLWCGASRSDQLSPDRQIVAAASRDWTIKVWNLEGQEVAFLEGHSDQINGLAFAPDGQTLASASEDCTVKLWSLDGTELATLTVPRSDIRSLVFSPNGQILATSTSSDRIIQLWSLDGTSLATLKNQAAVQRVCFSPDSRMLAAVNYEQTIRLWRLDGTQLATFESGISESDSAASSSDAQSLAAGSDRATMMRQRKKRRRRHERNSRICSVAFSPDGQILFAGSDNGTIKRWQLGLSLLALENVELPPLQGHTAAVSELIFSPDGQTLASGSADRTIKLWNPDGSLQATLTEKSQYANIIFSPDGKKLFATSRREAVKFWNLDRISAHQQSFSSYSLLKHKPGNWHISFSPERGTSQEKENEPTLLCHQGKRIGLWNPQTTVPDRVLKKYDEQSQDWKSVSSSSIAFSPDGQLLSCHALNFGVETDGGRWRWGDGERV